MIPSLIKFFSKRTTFLKLAIETSRDVTARFWYYHRQKGMARMHAVVTSWEHFPITGGRLWCFILFFFAARLKKLLNKCCNGHMISPYNKSKALFNSTPLPRLLLAIRIIVSIPRLPEKSKRKSKTLYLKCLLLVAETDFTWLQTLDLNKRS